jgi:hypothetical protein
MNVFDKVKAYGPAIALIVACGLSASAQGTPGGINVIASTVPANGDVNPYGVALAVISH